MTEKLYIYLLIIKVKCSLNLHPQLKPFQIVSFREIHILMTATFIQLDNDNNNYILSLSTFSIEYSQRDLSVKSLCKRCQRHSLL